MVATVQRGGKLFDCREELVDPPIDPHYKIFLDNLRKHGSSYILDMDYEGWGPVVVKYFEEDVALDDTKSTYSVNPVIKKDSQPRKKQSGTSLGAKASRKVKHSSVLKGTEEMDRRVDECYAKFLSLINVEGTSTTMELENGQTIVFEQGNDELPSETLEKQNAMPIRTPAAEKRKRKQISTPANVLGQVTNDSTPGLAIVKYVHESAASLRCGTTDFREKLKDVLSKPFDHNEYADLLKEFTDHKPITRERHLRGQSKLYKTTAMGPSYSDHYPDIAKQIDLADSRKRLQLLRKFFFWLENLTHDGAYKPWKKMESESFCSDDCIITMETGRDSASAASSNLPCVLLVDEEKETEISEDQKPSAAEIYASSHSPPETASTCNAFPSDGCLLLQVNTATNDFAAERSNGALALSSEVVLHAVKLEEPLCIINDHHAVIMHQTCENSVLKIEGPDDFLAFDTWEEKVELLEIDPVKSEPSASL